MKVRIKFAKYGALKFIGHLDVMRYMQKVIRKSEIDVAYSQGFNPHQLLYFASPLGVGLTSEGEYFDIVLNSPEPDIVKKLNDNSVEGIKILDAVVLDDKAKNSMSIIAAAKYIIALKDEYADTFACSYDEFVAKFNEYMALPQMLVNKKTKKSEREVDLKPLIFEWDLDYGKYIDGNDKYGIQTEIWENNTSNFDNKIGAYMYLHAGSEENLKAEFVMESFCNWCGIEFVPHAFQVHRIDMLAKNESDELVSLMDIDNMK